MKRLAPDLIREAGKNRKIGKLGASFTAKWREFFGQDPDIAEIQRFIHDSDQLCLSEEYYVSRDVSLVGPAILWNRKHGLLLTVDYFEGIVMGFLIRRELNELMGWRSSLRFENKQITKENTIG